MADEWTEVGGGGDNEMWDRTGSIQGQYVNLQENVGPNKSRIYTIKKDDGEEIGVWGSTVLDTKFDQIPRFSMVRITSLGKAQGKRAEYYDYKVEYRPTDASNVNAAIPGSQPLDNAATEPATQQDIL